VSTLDERELTTKLEIDGSPKSETTVSTAHIFKMRLKQNLRHYFTHLLINLFDLYQNPLQINRGF